MKLMLLLRVRRERTERKRERTSIRIRVMNLLMLTKEINFNLIKMIKRIDKEAIQDLPDLHLTRRTRRLKVPVTINQILQIQVPLLTKRTRKRRTREKIKKILRIIMIQLMMELRET